MTEDYEDNRWKSVSTICLWSGLIAASLFIIHAIIDEDGFLLFDYVNLPFHEFGHLFFGMMGETIGLWGGTLMQLLIPSLILINFWIKGDIPGTAFGIFWLGENLLNIAVYIADARSMSLPLVGGGLHDWNMILSDMGMLQHDKFIAVVVRTTGWLIIGLSIIWFLIKGIKNKV